MLLGAQSLVLQLHGASPHSVFVASSRASSDISHVVTEAQIPHKCPRTASREFPLVFYAFCHAPTSRLCQPRSLSRHRERLPRCRGLTEHPWGKYHEAGHMSQPFCSLRKSFDDKKVVAMLFYIMDRGPRIFLVTYQEALAKQDTHCFVLSLINITNPIQITLSLHLLPSSCPRRAAPKKHWINMCLVKPTSPCQGQLIPYRTRH